MARHGRATARREQAETVVEARRDLVQCDHAQTRRGKFQRERDSVQALAYLRDRARIALVQDKTRVSAYRAVDKQAYRFVALQLLDGLRPV